MYSVFAVFILAVAAHADELAYIQKLQELVDEDGAQYKLYHQFTNEIKLTKEDQDDLFHGLNVNGKDNVVDQEELNTFFWHDKVKYATHAFFKLVDNNKNGKIEYSDLNDEFQNNNKEKKNIRVALIECHYLLSKGLRESCFADQLLTYASLVLQDDDLVSFYEHIGGDDVISVDEAKGIAQLVEKNDPHNTAEELGAFYDGQGVSKKEFEDYVTQESIADDFRRCRKGPPKANGDVDFRDDCLKLELAEYINYDLTEMDISVLFRAVDTSNNGRITKDEIKALPDVKEAEVSKIMTLLDMSRTTRESGKLEVDYGEFRTFMRSPTVLLQLEKECTAKYEKQIDELKCIFKLFITLVKQEHDAIFLVVPDMEQQIAFEILNQDDKEDCEDNGKILTTELTFPNEVKYRFIAEVDTDKNGYVCLEEFNEYMDIPHMVYGIGDCLLQEKSTDGRGDCYKKEIQDIFTNIKYLDDNFWDSWFKFYNDNDQSKQLITKEDNNQIPERFGTEDLENLFLLELGQGDKTITKFEFKWYVKQQDLAKKYSDNFQGTTPLLQEFHDDLKKYIQDKMTEYDAQEFFKALDTKKDHELTEADFPKEWDLVKGLLKQMDEIEKSSEDFKNPGVINVHFREFWLWLNSPLGDGLVENVFETYCTEKKTGKNEQIEEIACYVEKIKDASLFT